MTEPDKAKQYAQSRIHGAGRAAWMAAPIKDELAMAYRAGQAASAERIKALKGAIDKLLSACERLDVYEVKSTELWAAYHFGLNVYDDFVWSPEENAEAAASAERIKALEEALAKADELCRVALPQFNWGASALDGKAIFILNEAPGIIRRALLKEADHD